MKDSALCGSYHSTASVGCGVQVHQPSEQVVTTRSDDGVTSEAVDVRGL